MASPRLWTQYNFLSPKETMIWRGSYFVLKPMTERDPPSQRKDEKSCAMRRSGS